MAGAAQHHGCAPKGRAGRPAEQLCREPTCVCSPLEVVFRDGRLLGCCAARLLLLGGGGGGTAAAAALRGAGCGARSLRRPAWPLGGCCAATRGCCCWPFRDGGSPHGGQAGGGCGAAVSEPGVTGVADGTMGINAPPQGLLQALPPRHYPSSRQRSAGLTCKARIGGGWHRSTAIAPQLPARRPSASPACAGGHPWRLGRPPSAAPLCLRGSSDPSPARQPAQRKGLRLTPDCRYGSSSGGHGPATDPGRRSGGSQQQAARRQRRWGPGRARCWRRGCRTAATATGLWLQVVGGCGKCCNVVAAAASN